ncbi:MAG TPA: hypothetical protein VGM30_10470 [Puia sp.]|jgi:hypothetical protein
MSTRQESIGLLIRYVLYHFKSIEERLSWSKATNGFIQQDKHTLNKAIQKVVSAIEDVLTIVRNPELIRAMRAEINKQDLAYYMVLTEQLFDLKEEDLVSITDLIDQYLKQKYGLEDLSPAAA